MKQYLWSLTVILALILLISPSSIAAAPNKSLIAAGEWHTLAIQKDGSLWAWGNNGYGQLGLGDTTDRLNPTKLPRFNAPRAAVIPLF